MQDCFRSAHYKIVSDIKWKSRIAGIPEVSKTDDHRKKEREIIIYSMLAATPS